MIKNYHYSTYLHSVRVSNLAYKIGERVGFNSQELEQLKLSALLHDMGKLKVSKSILDKPTKLDPIEWDSIKKHPLYGVEMLQHSYLLSNEAMEGVFSHHEYYNGEGYPRGLKGESINSFARVIAIADAIDAMTTQRSYRPYQQSLQEAIREIHRCKGTQFDPYVCHQITSLNYYNCTDVIKSNLFV
jgi:putative nucleotidyltransferase with HDIG domain